jgi:hypothetical protein
MVRTFLKVLFLQEQIKDIIIIITHINIGANVWGESIIMTGVYERWCSLLCTSDGVCVIVYVKFSSVGAGTVFLGGVSSFWD